MTASPKRPAPAADDVTLTVTVHWNQDLIAVKHLTGTASAAIGDVPATLAPVPCDMIGAPGWVFANLDRGRAQVTVPAGITAMRVGAGGAVDRVEGPARAALSRGESIELGVGAFVIRAEAAAPETAKLSAPLGARARQGAALHIGLAAVAHAIVFGLAVQDSMASEREADEAQPAELKQLLVAAEQRARALDVTVHNGSGMNDGGDVNSRIGDGRAGGGARASGAEGKMGDPSSRSNEHRRYAVTEQTPHDRDLTASREAALKDAAEFGMVGLLANSAQSPVAPWFGKDEARGADPIAASGEMWARLIGSEYAPGGLSLSGIGQGGGGKGEGIGLGTIGTLGHTTGRPGGGTGGGGALAFGLGRAGGGGWWDDVGLVGRGRIGSHRARVWADRWGGGYGVVGRIPPDIIQRIIRQNFGRFRACYESGLVHAPDLEGTVAVSFVIGRDGSVSSAKDGGSTMPDPAVTRCVVRAFYGLSFPQPEFGIVTVLYPIKFQKS